MGRSITQEKTFNVEDLGKRVGHRRFGRGRFAAAVSFFCPFLGILFGILTNAASAASIVQPQAVSKIEKPNRSAITFDSVALDRSRELIPMRTSLKGISESAIVEYLQDHPESLRHDLASIIRELNAQPKNRDTTKHVRLIPPSGQSGYEDLRIFVSHSYRAGEKLLPASNLIQVLKDAIQSATTEIALNVYEFDLEEIASELVKVHKEKKIAIRVGVDKKPLKSKPLQQALVDRMREGGIDVTEVDSSKINHQKMIAIDWSDPKLSHVVFSSGNFTHSCLDPLGDLPTIKPHPEKSIPNANHIITMKSWIAANLINHEITKTFSKALHLRGGTFPTTGAYQITGPGVNPQTLEAYPENSFIIAFTPGGGYRAVNRNILAHLIEKSEGPIRMTQFAYSSKDVAAALLKRAERDLQATGKFDFVGVGDTPFAMQGWSQFLKMSGMKRVVEGKGPSKVTTYQEDELNPWKKSLTKKQLTELRKNIFIAPYAYGKSMVKVGGQSLEVTAKIHHKIMSMGNFAVIGTSFNFSESAEKNNEQLLVFNDAKMADVVRGITARLVEQSPRTVFEEALRRTTRAKKTNKEITMDGDRLTDHELDDEEISPADATL